MRPKRALIWILMIAGGAYAQGEIPAGYELKWSDEFDYVGAPDPAKWTHETGGGGWGNQEEQFYTDSLDNSRVEDGRLIIEVHQELSGRTPTYTSARLITREKAQWKYGRIEARAKIPKETGTWSAIWMLAADKLNSEIQWPDNGEIDIMEAVGYENDPIFQALPGKGNLPNIHGTVHFFLRNGRDNFGVGGAVRYPEAVDEFKTYAINWTAEKIEWEVDGVVYFTHLRSDWVPGRNPPENPWQEWPFNQRFFLILNVAMGGTWGGHFNSDYYGAQTPYDSTGINHDGVWPQRMEVDWVRVYGPDTPPPASPVPGQVLATDMDAGDGILLEISNNPESPHHATSIDAGDTAEFVLQAAQGGLYEITASISAPAAGGDLAMEIVETGSTTGTNQLPQTGSYENWSTVIVGEVMLQPGSNTLRMSTNSGQFNLAWLKLEAGAGSIWKGLPIDSLGNAETGTWLGRINVNTAPWIYSYRVGNFLYMPSALEETFHTDSQWIYIPRN